MQVATRQGLIVLGMHRSGTSALTALAVRLGMAGPRTPLAASADNPEGFYEPKPVVVVNHQILTEAQCTWNLCLHFAPEQLAAKMHGHNQQVVQATLVREFGGAGSFVLKDPRLCLTLPAWLPCFPALGVAPAVMILARHPAEVIKSLEVRNGLPAYEILPNWLHHMLEAERGSRGLQRAVMLYEDLLGETRHTLARATATARVAWPAPDADIAGVLSPAMRHHAVPRSAGIAGLVPVDEMVNAAWNAFGQLQERPEDAAALRTLDQIWERFAAWRRVAMPEGTQLVTKKA
jgi:hypothetical protein